MVNLQLLEYIKSEEAQGYTPEQLRQYLVQQGYSEAEVDEAINSANAPVQSQATESKESIAQRRPVGVSVMGYIFIVLGIIGLVGAAFMLVGSSVIVATLARVKADVAAATYILPGIILGLAVFVIVVDIILILTGWGILKLKRWARIIAIIYSIMALPGIPLGTIMGIVFLVILFKDETKKAFGITG